MSLRSALPLFVFNKLGTRSISQISNLLKARHDLCRAQLTVASYNKHVLHIKVPAILVLTWMLRIASSSSKVSQLPIQRHHSAYGAVRWSNDFIFIEYRISKLSKRELIIGFWAQFKDNPVTEWRNLWIMNWARWSRELTVCSWCCSSTVYKNKCCIYTYTVDDIMLVWYRRLISSICGRVPLAYLHVPLTVKFACSTVTLYYMTKVCQHDHSGAAVGHMTEDVNYKFRLLFIS